MLFTVPVTFEIGFPGSLLRVALNERLFCQKEYRDILVESLNYCIGRKGLIVYAVLLRQIIFTLSCQQRNMARIQG